MPGVEQLVSVAASSSTDVWAVGANTSGTAIVLHWNGRTWQNQLRRANVELQSVIALSPSDVWAAGSEVSDNRLLELHWNGRRWSGYSQAWRGADTPTLEALAVDGAGGIWAAGQGREPGEPAWPVTALVHRTGAHWRSAPPPGDQFVEAAALRVPGEVWLATIRGDGDAYGGPFLERLVGTHWQETHVPFGGAFSGLAPDALGGLWGVVYVGSFPNELDFPTSARPIIERARCS
jgi:hypothetical protein